LLERADRTVFLAVMQGDELLYLDKKENPMNPVRFASNIGSRRPPHFGMMGQVLMADLAENQVQRLLEKYPLTAFTKRSITSVHSFKETLRRVKKQGYAIDEGVAIEGIGGIAAPVRDFTGGVVAAIGVGFMVSSVKGKELKRIVKEVLETAHAISRELGYVPIAAEVPRVRSVT
jgi:DNA-binding IclR family transcriptional regulator